ncbi:ABC transporter substrate-binding protein [Szabonella alba]|uniref:ABC transporter substrate-binding protein n=1 Tax=Szabonella alba TaxID=2804194 RepID=A0A8K0Y0J5_9RHOB|nr:ABC transporter substrate-binding protein [Szabonella alba]MBL4917911.1 ABC transporter substrate-binding protein [Szabonella alba]
MKRLLIATTVLAGGLAISADADAQTRTLYLGSYGGSTETLMKEQIIPEFEAMHDVRIEYVAGNSTENLARLQAQRGAQELDVVMLDDGPMYQAMQLGFCGPITDIPNLDDAYDIARMGDTALGLGVVSTVFGYNTEVFEANGWEPPTSWNDLADEKYKGRLSIPPISNTYGLHTLIMLARMQGGSEADIDPGFAYLADTVGPNVLAFEASPGRMSELFQNEEVVLAVWGSGRLVSLQDTGYPVEMAYPSEGGVALMIAGCPIADSPNADLAQAFLNFLIEPENQVHFAETQGWGPVNRKVELTPETAARVPYGPEQVDNLIAIDWDLANENRQDWTRRWAREIER